MRLIIDWIAFLYIILPGMAVSLFVLWKYYHGAYTSGLTSATMVFAGQVPLSTILVVSITLLMLLWHLMIYGNIPFSLETGDKVFAFLSPLSRTQLLMTLWIEGWIWSTLPLLVLYLLTLPLLPVLHVTPFRWLLLVILMGGYESVLRLQSQLWNDRDSFRWRRWLAFNALRIMSLLPVAFFVPRVLLSEGWGVLILFVVFFGAIVGLAFRDMLRRPWDNWMQFRPNRLVNLAVPVDLEDSSKVHFRMRLPSRWLVGGLEQIRRTPLSPMTWLLILRILRRKQLFRDLAMFTAAAILPQTLSPLVWVKFLGVGFAALMLAQWWTITIRPLAEKPIEEQTAIDPWALRVQTSRLMVGTITLFVAFWVLLGLVLHA